MIKKFTSIVHRNLQQWALGKYPWPVRFGFLKACTLGGEFHNYALLGDRYHPPDWIQENHQGPLKYTRLKVLMNPYSHPLPEQSVILDAFARAQRIECVLEVVSDPGKKLFHFSLSAFLKNGRMPFYYLSLCIGEQDGRLEDLFYITEDLEQVKLV